MILKNKIIFGTIGFLVASGITALVVILATSDDESSPKAKVKTKLDVSTLSSDSFKVSGTQTLGVVNLKSEVTLPKQIELKYFIGANAPTDEKSFIVNKPSNLKNGDIVYIKFFIKKASITNYEFKDEIKPVKFVVSGLQLTTISHSLLVKESFVISGSQTQGEISKKPIITLPKQVEIKYFRGAEAPNQDEVYKLNMPINLNNGDKVHIKFFVKKEYATTHKFANDFTNLLTIPITTLPKTEIDSSLLVKESFVINGSQTKGAISKRTNIIFPNEVETKYFQGADVPNSDNAYNSNAPTDLSNDDKVHIKFFIKQEYIRTHKFASSFVNSITITIKGLKNLIDHRDLEASSFAFINGVPKTIRWKSDATLPEQVIIKYYKSSSNVAPLSDDDYETNVPINLSEGDNIYIKFFIKERFKDTHKFADRFKNMVHLEIKNNSFKTIIATSNFKKDFFEIIGNEGTATIKLKSRLNLPNEVEVKYAKSNLEPTLDSVYSAIAPINLNNNDIIYIKFFIKDSFITSHEFLASGFTNPFIFKVSGLKTLIDHRTLKKNSFEVSGTQSQATIGWKTKSENPILPDQVEVRYYKGPIKPNSDSSYKITQPLALSNNDLIHIKFFIKKEYVTTYEFASGFVNYVPFVISDLDKNEVEVASLNANSFKTTGNHGSGTIGIKVGATLPSEVGVKYAKNSRRPNLDSEYSSIAPTNLSNGDIVYIYFFIKDIFKTTHKLPTSGFTNPLPFEVSDLKILIDTTDLVNDSFKVVGTPSAGIIRLKDRVTLPSQVEPRYATNRKPILDSEYSSIAPTNLNNGDVVYIKFFIQDRFKDTHKLPTSGFDNQFQFVVKDLDKNEIEVTTLVSSSFEAIGTIESGTVRLKDRVTLPSEVEPRYGKANIKPTQDSEYSSTAPTNLSNGDNVYVKFFIKSEYIATHKFADDFTNLITIPILDLLKIEIDATFLVRGSFVISGSQTRGTISKKTDVTFPSEVEAKYFKGANDPNGDSEYQLSPPTNLSNGDKVYVKFFIKEGYTTTHKFADDFANLIPIPILDLPKIEIDNSFLVQDSFVTSGSEGKGTISKKTSVTFPSEVEARYFRGTNAPNQDSAYGSSGPTFLSNGDIVHIKFFIKDGFKDTHKFLANKFTNPIQFVIRDLKILIDTTDLVNDSFKVVGIPGKATIELNDDTTLPNKVEAKYVTNYKPSRDSEYSSTSPTNLNNGDVVYIKFFVRDSFNSTHKLPTSEFDNPIQFVVSGLKTSIANNGKSILQDSSGNIWLLYEKQPLQVLRKKSGKFASSWINDLTQPDLLKGSNITNGKDGVIFEDSNGNIWAMGADTPLQVLIKNADNSYADSWINDSSQPGLLKDSNITNGIRSTIFEDSKGNIWAMGANTPLQVLKKERNGFADSWINDPTQPGLLMGSKITSGWGGTIFEDSNGNIWAMGNGTPLQVLKKERDGFASSWINDNTQSGLLKDSNITDGNGGTVFEDSQGNIWAMGSWTKLQVLKREEDGFASSWISDPTKEGLLKGVEINNGHSATIFEDSQGNIWTMGSWTKLQVLKREEDGFANSWTSDNYSPGLLNGSNITNGNGGTIFEDSSGNIWAIGSATRLQVLKKEGGGFASSWINDNTQPGLLMGSEITNGYGEVIFEDSSGNIWASGNLILEPWATGKEEPLLQVLQKKDDGFVDRWNNYRIPNLLKGSEIKNGASGSVFEDSKGNIWAMGRREALQVLVKKESGSYFDSWATKNNQPGLLNGSKITNGSGGVIFEDSRGNIWAMGYGTPLQVLKKEGDRFATLWISSTTEEGLLKGSEITDGGGGTVFEDSNGNIWAMGDGTPLQVLKKEGSGFADSWTSDTNSKLLKGSKITDGWNGMVFEDSNGNIWAMGYGTPLQVLKKEGSGFVDSWTSDSAQEGLLKDSNIRDGTSGVIFEDSRGNIWAMGYETPLQVLVKNADNSYADSWINDSSQSGLLKGSKITNGSGGVIFEDSSGNIWAMGYGTPLQVLKKERDGFASSWINDPTQPGLVNGSNIINGRNGVIFEDSSGNIWAMGWLRPLQMLKRESSGFATSWTSNTNSWLLKGSNITNGLYGVIFEDSSGNIWAMGYGTPLQVLKKVDRGFV